jgi:hypothetical protein
VATNSSTVSSPLLTILAFISAAAFGFLLFLVWRHNHTAYAQQYAQWDRSFLCERCGAISQQDL